MKIKRFQAQSMREAIRLVREEQGPDAVILSNRRTADGIEVVAAVDYDAALIQQTLRRAPDENPEAEAPATAKNQSSAKSAVKAQAEAHAAMDMTQTADKRSAPPADRSRVHLNAAIGNAFAPDTVTEPSKGSSLLTLARLHAAGPAPANVKADSAPLAKAPVTNPRSRANASRSDFSFQAPSTQTAGESAAESTLQAPTPVSVDVSSKTSGGMTNDDGEEVSRNVGVAEFRTLQNEMKTMRKLLEEQLAGMMWGDMQQRRPRQAAALRSLADLGIEPGIAREIAEEIPDSSDSDRARFLPLGLLSRRVAADCADPVMAGGVIALVGPTGVGKTTTIAKLAARYAARFGARDVALVTMDHYRVGAPEQLFTYGRLLGVPVHAVGANDDLGETLNRLRDRKLILIDTAGMSQRDKALNAQLERLRAIGDELHTFLVLAANAQPASIEEVVRRFGQLTPAGCVLTKIDEASRVGGVLSVAIRRNLPIAYFTDGQRVPEDLHAASADRLVLRATQLVRQAPAPIDDGLLATGFSDLVSAHA